VVTQPDGSTVTAFGTVTKDRVTYNYKKGWFSGGAREDIPLRHVTSVAVGTTRHVVWGILVLVVAVAALAAGSAGIVIGILLLAVAALILWGSPKVMLNTAGGDHRPSGGLPWTKPEAEKFASALRRELFKE
jgi:hypothetical protein